MQNGDKWAFSEKTFSKLAGNIHFFTIFEGNSWQYYQDHKCKCLQISVEPHLTPTDLTNTVFRIF